MKPFNKTYLKEASILVGKGVNRIGTLPVAFPLYAPAEFALMQLGLFENDCAALCVASFESDL